MQKRRLNILFVLYALNNGGAEMLAIRLCKYLGKDRFNVFLCTLADQGALREVAARESIHLFTLGKREGRDYAIAGKLRRIICENDIDIVHTHNQGPLIYSVMACFPRKSFKLVHTEHINMMDEFSYGKKHLFYNRCLYRFLDGFVSIANHLTRELTGQYPLLVSKAVTIRNAVDLSHLKMGPKPGDLRKELGLGADAILLGNISALRRQKDHATMLEAMGHIAGQNAKCYLVIAGDGECREILEKMVVELGLEKRVFFLGYRSDIENLLSQFSIFLLTSLYEGLPLCLLEAMAMECPVVATDVSGTNELVAGGETGILVPAQDPSLLAAKVLELLGDSEQRARLVAAAGRALGEEFDFSAMIRRYEGYYCSLFAEKKQ